MSVLISFFFSFSLISADAPAASSLLAESLQLLQKNEKPKALKLLEKAFENTQDTDELREICVLILEASPTNYPKRDAYLRYLTKMNAEHVDAYKWMKELGDRSLDKGKLEEAEDWYLRALSSTDQKALINYKLAFVKWNLKQPIDALRLFLEVFDMDEPSLQSQVKKDIPKLWLEIGVLPSNFLGKIASLSEENLKEILESLFVQLKKIPSFGTKEEDFLAQLIDNSKAKPATLEFLNDDVNFKRQPCFPFKKLVSSQDVFSRNLFLACLKSPDRPAAEKLLPFFGGVTDPDEKILWAHSELLAETGKKDEALFIVFQPGNFESRSQDFLSHIESLLLQFDEENFRSFYSQFKPEFFEHFISSHFSQKMMDRLQVMDADKWIPFEGEKLKGKETTEYLLKKGVWISQKPNAATEELQSVLEKLIKSPQTQESKTIGAAYKGLVTRSSSKLPAVFSKAFNSGFNKWIGDIDKYLVSLNSSPARWQAIAKPVFQVEVQKNVDALVAQLDASSLDPAQSELAETFVQRKEEIKNDLKSKYLTVVSLGETQK